MHVRRRRRTLTFSASAVEMRGLDGLRAQVRTPAGTFTLDTPLTGFGNLSNILAATAVAVHFDVPLDGRLRSARRSCGRRITAASSCASPAGSR